MTYVLGMDGGNTKTDYLLHTLDGRRAGYLRAGTCSHEKLGMDGAKREMDARIAALLGTAGVRREDIAGAAFGLAGVDQPLQKDDLTAIVRSIGFHNAVVMNDAFLGIKAGSETGVGVCSVNGTGTVAGGIDADGKWLQVGGIGAPTGDAAGGGYLASRTLCAAYDAAFRFGEETALLPCTLKLLDCSNVDGLMTAISTKFQYGKAVSATDILQMLFETADAGDAVAIGIVRRTADSLARSAAGCAVRLRFDGEVPVVLIGSVWTKGRYQPMIDWFAQKFEEYAGKKACIHILEVPPAAGSVLWALELAMGRVPGKELRETVFGETRGL